MKRELLIKFARNHLKNGLDKSQIRKFTFFEKIPEEEFDLIVNTAEGLINKPIKQIPLKKIKGRTPKAINYPCKLHFRISQELFFNLNTLSTHMNYNRLINNKSSVLRDILDEIVQIKLERAGLQWQNFKILTPKR